jgi:4-hydroxy-2-oxoheptanedioate aldolase
MKETLKEKMSRGETVFGTWCMLPSSFVVDVIARTGIDFVVIDLEHGSMSFETAEEMVRAAQLFACQPIIRVGDDQENTILHALETNCGAIMVPHVSTKEAAMRIVNAARYAPLGNRGLSPYTRCHGYTHDGFPESMKKHATDTLVGVLVEGLKGIENLEDISSTTGIDLVYLGMYDISQSVGLPGLLEHPLVLEQLEKCLSIIKKAGKFAGTFSREISASRTFKDMGFNFVAYVADSYGLTKFYNQAISEFKA